MKTVRLLEYGGQLVFNDVPTPTIARDEILVKIKSTAVNHLDLVKASGMARQILPIDLPWIPGHEFSGVVEQIGSDVAACAPGDAVFGTSGMGAYAEYLAVKPAAIARKPSNLSFEEAASVPVAAQTAWQGIFTHGRLAKGQTILIHGGAGAVGAYAVQLAAQGEKEADDEGGSKKGAADDKETADAKDPSDAKDAPRAPPSKGTKPGADKS